MQFHGYFVIILPMEIKDELITWFKANHRELPFRKNKDPYSIWVSEIMAQQTRIDTMIPYYERWMEKYPTIEALAFASIEDVLKSWEGLGYYTRARKLHEGAKQVLTQYGGKLPSEADQLEKIAGIGPYTAGAIASIAFGKPSPAVDGNVLRVVSRLLMLEEDVMKASTHKKVKTIVKEWMKDCEASAFTEGLMELGALVCMPQVVLCDTCPLKQKCLAYAKGVQKAFPIKSKPKKPQEYYLKTLIICHENQIVMSQDDSDGLMKGLWRLPQKEIYDSSQDIYIGKRKHVFSHRIWQMEIYEKTGPYTLAPYEKWIEMDQLDQLSIVGAHKKILMNYFDNKTSK